MSKAEESTHQVSVEELETALANAEAEKDKAVEKALKQAETEKGKPHNRRHDVDAYG